MLASLVAAAAAGGGGGVAGGAALRRETLLTSCQVPGIDGAGGGGAASGASGASAASPSTLFSIQAPEVGPPAAEALDLVLCIDVSGSMGTYTYIKNEDGRTRTGLTQLQLVVYSAKTLLRAIASPAVRVGIVAYSTTAEVCCEMVQLNNRGLVFAEGVLSALQHGGYTNLWDGIKTSYGLLDCKGVAAPCGAPLPGAPLRGLHRRSAVLLMTDGLPFSPYGDGRPLEGEAAAFKTFLAKNPWASDVAMHVVGFGSGANLDSNLLLQLATDGGGCYNYIPSADMVGTNFVNFAALLASTATGETALVAPAPNPSIIRVGPLLLGQTRHLLLHAATATLHFQQLEGAGGAAGGGAGGGSGGGAGDPAMLDDAFAPKPLVAVAKEASATDMHEARVQVAREYVSRTLLAAWKMASAGACAGASVGAGASANLKEALKMVTALATELAASPAAADPRVKALVQDLEGEVALALSSAEAFAAWGVHYLPSLARAHTLQYCHNFKDPGVQSYATPAFVQQRDKATAIFASLPAPTGIVSYIPGMEPVGQVTAPQVVQVNMSRFTDDAGSCFWGDSKILMADGTKKVVKELKPGDEVRTQAGTGARIVLIVRSEVTPDTRLVRLRDLLITAFHPVWWSDGNYILPVYVSDAQGTVSNWEKATGKSIPYVYSVALDTALMRDGSSSNPAEFCVIVDDVPVITLAHGSTHPVLFHPFFGTRNVLDALTSHASFKNGIATLEPGSAVRDPMTGLICGFH